jgi:hypothetical protein
MLRQRSGGGAISMLLIIIAIIVFCIISAYTKKREEFVKETSIALGTLTEINSRHSFLDVPCCDMASYYDNRNYYENISPLDYLTYQLVHKQKTILSAVKDAEENSKRIIPYQAEVASCSLGKFGLSSTEKSLSSLDQKLRDYWLDYGYERICEIEKTLFDAAIRRPVTSINIEVRLYLTNIQGRKLTCKAAVFSTPNILQTIDVLRHKTNGYYSDPEVWHAICRVERGKVSNKMRFAVYNRDGNRCRKCGSTRDLEVDHIYPISKGGKSTFDNLQTLCHRCNIEKGSFIEPNAATPRNVQHNSKRFCPNCGIPLVKRHGSYGEFWGCPNYPRCRYTSK